MFGLVVWFGLLIFGGMSGLRWWFCGLVGGLAGGLRGGCWLFVPGRLVVLCLVW